VRLLLYNPNTDAALTERLAAMVSESLDPADTLVTRTAREGPAFIGSGDTIAAARARLAGEIAEDSRTCDAVLLGCFGDLGVDPFRRAVRRPILSLAEACFAIAPLTGQRLGILTTSAFWEERLAADIEVRGLSRNIVAVRGSHDFSSDAPEARLSACRSEIAHLAESGAEVVVLGGALLTDLRSALLADSPLPILDMVAATVALCRSLAMAKAAAEA
jgi:Asp/Glu/hydantoin racemase